MLFWSKDGHGRSCYSNYMAKVDHLLGSVPLKVFSGLQGNLKILAQPTRRKFMKAMRYVFESLEEAVLAECLKNCLHKLGANCLFPEAHASVQVSSTPLESFLICSLPDRKLADHFSWIWCGWRESDACCKDLCHHCLYSRAQWPSDITTMSQITWEDTFKPYCHHTEMFAAS